MQVHLENNREKKKYRKVNTFQYRYRTDSFTS